MSSDRDRQLMTAREFDRASTALINVGINAVKRNPIKVTAYILGLLLCFLFTGWKVTNEQRQLYYNELNKIDSHETYQLEQRFYEADRLYQQSKGWFSCDATCQSHQQRRNQFITELKNKKSEETRILSNAKKQLGLFSEYGVEETRNLFLERFQQGKGFASRQTKWDALFYGISAMGRDESFIGYIFRLIISFLFNFTIGMIGTLIVFITNLISMIQSYQVNLIEGLIFFGLASLAALSFVLTWLIGLYTITAGTVFVGAKLIATNMRIEDNPERSGSSRRRVHYS